MGGSIRKNEGQRSREEGSESKQQTGIESRNPQVTAK